MTGLNKDQINKLIFDNELFHGVLTGMGVVMDIDHLEKFAKLVAAAEREAIIGLLKGIDQTDCESKDGYWETSFGAAFGKELLSTIRARGNNAA